MKQNSDKLLASLVLLASTFGVLAQPASDVLAQLSENLQTVRTASGPEPVGTQPIDVDALLGVSRDSIATALGVPDNCEDLESKECSGKEQWYFWFFYLPSGWRGGGPELWLDFNSDAEVVKAEWHFSR